MDLIKTITELREQRDKLDAVIKQLETLEGSGTVSPHLPRRGRKFMTEAERREVSVRMKRYWASRPRPKPAG
jgi:hypothetical protein